MSEVRKRSPRHTWLALSTPQQSAKVARFVKENPGFSYSELARRLGISRQLAIRLCKAQGIESGLSLEDSGLVEFEKENKKRRSKP
jgi:predicted HTH transcriptional regulator